MNKKYIFLKADNKSVFFKNIKNSNIQKYYILSSKNIIYKVLKKLNLLFLIFDSWRFEIKKYDYVILGENGYDKSVTKMIKRKNKKCKIIVYFWNIINDDYRKILKDERVDEFWTFDRKEAENYNMRYNPQFYTKDILMDDGASIKHDVLYLGRAKDRKEELLKLQNKINENEIKTNFIIIEKEKYFISYSDYLKLVFESKCLFDYNQHNQIGLSLRPMEALFFNKKLITNNLDIENYDFYNPNNIFILGKDNLDNIKKFIESPYMPVEEEVVEYYDFEQWVKRFGLE